MTRVLACLPAHELAAGLDFLSQQFADAHILWHQSHFEHSTTDPVTEILLYVEDDMARDDNALRLLACRDFGLLFFSKTTNPHWPSILTRGTLAAETPLFVLWNVVP